MPSLQLTPEFSVAACSALIFLLLWISSAARRRKDRKRFASIISVEDEVAKLERKVEQLDDERSKREKGLEDLLARHIAEKERAEQAQAEVRTRYEALAEALKQVEEDSNCIEVGLYKPHFNWDDPDVYRRAIAGTRDEMKRMIQAGTAIVWGASWKIEGSDAKGEKMQKQYGNLMLRAFNGECEAAISNVTWNNAAKLEARLEKDFEAINKLGSMMKAELNIAYLGLRLKELRLVYEHARKKQEVAEEQRRIREQMREEERVQRELEKARQEAEADERRFQKALERAREEASKAKGAELDELNRRVQELQKNLDEAHARGERAVSQAQLTKTGHVYIISNIGSFGHDVFKIGMTRRIDPMERVKELGDASVPFAFDVHALIHSSDAPALEAQLHRNFADRRINLVNEKKEFFKVELHAIAEFARNQGLQVDITLLAEAQEYRESELKRSSRA
jgi:hypothetical protein